MEEGLELGMNVFADSDDSPLLDLFREDASKVLAIGAIALNAVRGPKSPYIESLLRIAFGVDNASLLLRRTMLGKPSEPFHDIEIPKHLLEFGEELRKNTCLLGISHALGDFGRAVAVAKVEVWIKGIENIVPNKGCAGDRITIRGSGFGTSQPNNTGVFMPKYRTECIAAHIVSWSDTEVVVIAPNDVGTECIGFFRTSSRNSSESLASAASSLAGEMEQCLGFAASRAAESIRTGGSIPHVECPQCATDGANLFHGGPPLIDYFVGNDRYTTVETVELVPDASLKLSWSVKNAESITIVPIQPQGFQQWESL